MGARGRRASPLDVLTPREREILVEMARGASNAAIAETLGLTKRAVEKHINSVFAKLDLPLSGDVSRRVRAVLLFLGGTDRVVPTRRHDLGQAGWIGPCDPAGRSVQSSPGSDVALRSAAFARPRPRPAGPRPAVVQTAVAGAALAAAAGVVVAPQPLPPPSSASRGCCTAALIAAMTVGRVRRAAPWHRAPAVAGPAHAGALLGDGPRHRWRRPASMPSGRSHGRRCSWSPSTSCCPFRRAGSPIGSHAGSSPPTALGAVLVWGALLATAERLPEFMPSASCQGGCPRNPLRIVGGGAALGDALAVASWSLTAGALIAVAVALTFRMRTASAIGRRTTSPILVSVLAVAGTFAAAAVARAGGAAPATLERLGWFSTATTLTDPLRLPRGHAGRAGVRRRGAGTARGPAQRRRPRRRRPPRPRRRAGRPVAHGRVLAPAAQRVRRRARPSRAARPPGPPGAPRPSSAMTAIPWR